MSTTKKASKTKESITDDQLISWYMEGVLRTNAMPQNVYVFCKENKIEELDFYRYYGSLDALQQDIWVKFFDNVKATIAADENYLTYSNQNKLLTLYFSLIEILTLNRSYVTFVFAKEKKGLKNLQQLNTFRKDFKRFVADIIATQSSETDKKVNKLAEPIYVEGAWVEFLLIFKFWLEDTSKGFEKTDVIIEKAVKATFDLFNAAPLESLLDLGKFVWKEKFS